MHRLPSWLLCPSASALGGHNCTGKDQGSGSFAASKPFGLSALLPRSSSPSAEGLGLLFELCKAEKGLY